MHWYTADTHAYHTNIIKYCNRPFNSADEMNEVMIRNTNDRVGVDDTLHHLGDFSFGPRNKSHNAAEYRAQINCKNIVLVFGNHDRMRYDRDFRNLFTKTGDLMEIYDPVVEEKIVLCHFAMRVWPASHHGRWHLYGHSHGHLDPTDTFSFDVGVDCHDFAPINSNDIAGIMKKKYDSGIRSALQRRRDES